MTDQNVEMTIVIIQPQEHRRQKWLATNGGLLSGIAI